MRTILIILIPLSIALSTGCYTPFMATDALDLAQKHKNLAILPTEYHEIDIKNLLQDQCEHRFHLSYENQVYILKELGKAHRKDPQGLYVFMPGEDFNFTPAYGNESGHDLAKYCRELGVDALILSEIEIVRFPFWLDILCHLWDFCDASTTVRLSLCLYDHQSDAVIYRYEMEGRRALESAQTKSTIVRSMIRPAVKNLPYFNRTRKRLRGK